MFNETASLLVNNNQPKMSFARSVLRLTQAARLPTTLPSTTLSHSLRTAPISLARGYATLSPHTPPPTKPYEVFDEPAKARQRDRAVLRVNEAVENEGIELEMLDYLREEVADRICERIEVSHIRAWFNGRSCCQPALGNSTTSRHHLIAHNFIWVASIELS